jgi:hypothetical protein
MRTPAPLPPAVGTLKAALAVKKEGQVVALLQVQQQQQQEGRGVGKGYVAMGGGLPALMLLHNPRRQAMAAVTAVGMAAAQGMGSSKTQAAVGRVGTAMVEMAATCKGSVLQEQELGTRGQEVWGVGQQQLVPSQVPGNLPLLVKGSSLHGSAVPLMRWMRWSATRLHR